jgi:hypothetical protein
MPKDSKGILGTDRTKLRQTGYGAAKKGRAWPKPSSARIVVPSSSKRMSSVVNVAHHAPQKAHFQNRQR